MPLISFTNRNIRVQVEAGTTLMQCIRKAGLRIEAPCNAVGKCGKCKVKAYGDLYDKTEQEFKYAKEEHIRLACLAKVKGDVEIQLLDKENNLKTVNKGFSIDVDINSTIKTVKLPLINDISYVPYKDTLDYQLYSSNLLKKIGLLERNMSKNIYGIIYKNKLLDITDDINIILGAAVDIGTTGISAYLINLKNGEVLNRISALNPQTEFGGDVISRISFSINENNGIDILSKCIREKINSMIRELVNEKYKIDDIYGITIAANTTMLHLFLGVIPDSIANAPYRAVFLNEINLRAKELDVEINEEGMLTLLPSVSSYVGADIVAGIIAVDFHNRKHPALFIDIGTNGEIVAIFNEKMAATSTAAGPALEGMNISCGMRAEEGAIDTFSIDKNYNINYSTIGNIKARGICGSGLIDIAANLVKSGIVLSSGRFNKELPEKLKGRIVEKNFYICDEVYISQKDIREIQLAKGAISAGINMLLKEIYTNIENIDEIVVAGAFGSYINPESIKTIGLIPKGFKGKINFVGNSSIEGARIALVNEEKLQFMSEIKKNIRVVELSMKEEFQENFITSLNF